MGFVAPQLHAPKRIESGLHPPLECDRHLEKSSMILAAYYDISRKRFFYNESQSGYLSTQSQGILFIPILETLLL